MEKITAKLGPDHPTTPRTIDNLASIYHSQGQIKEAEKLQAMVRKVFFHSQEIRALQNNRESVLGAASHCGGKRSRQSCYLECARIVYFLQMVHIHTIDSLPSVLHKNRLL